MQNTTKTLEYYKRLPYTLHLELRMDSNKSNYWTADYIELSGCKTDGMTDVEAVANLAELFDEYVSALIEEGLEIPEPKFTPIEAKSLWINYPTERVSSDTKETKGSLQFQERSKSMAVAV